MNLWEQLADHYRGQPVGRRVQPGQRAGRRRGRRTSDRSTSASRRRSARSTREHILFLDGNRYSTQFDQLGDPLPNCVYTAHDYALPGFVDGGPYPGESRGRFVDRDQVEETFLERTAYMRETGTPIWVGEFGPVYTGDPVRDEQRYRLLEDQLEIYDRYDASWALWTYKDIGLQGLVHADPDSAYLRRIAPVLEKKARLGVDSWGSTDAWRPPHPGADRGALPNASSRSSSRIRGEPRRWIHGHIRHVMLAEAMVDDFARAFEGVRPDEAERLADAFAFGECRVREPLARILGGSAAGND